VSNYKNGDNAKLGYMQHILEYTICTCVRSTLQKENNAANVTDVENNSDIVQDI
jgi:hypothetical protein